MQNNNLYSIHEVQDQIAKVKSAIENLEEVYLHAANIVAQSEIRTTKDTIGNNNISEMFDSEFASISDKLHELKNAFWYTNYRCNQIIDLRKEDNTSIGFSVNNNKKED